jgi:hypothetical protein
MSAYTDNSILFEKKEEWRARMLQRPIEEKIEVANRLRKLQRDIPKLTRTRQAAKASGAHSSK